MGYCNNARILASGNFRINDNYNMLMIVLISDAINLLQQQRPVTSLRD